MLVLIGGVNMHVLTGGVEGIRMHVLTGPHLRIIIQYNT